MKPWPAIAIAGFAILALAGCRDEGSGYVEIRSLPGSAGRGPALYLDASKLDTPKSGVTILRRAIGTTKLQTETFDGAKVALCNLTVKKNRITTVMLTADRPPRCQCLGVTTASDTPGSRTCVS